MVQPQRITVSPGTQLSLDFGLEGATPCILIPEEEYDAQACAGVPSQEASQGGGQSVRALVILRQEDTGVVLTVTSIARPGIGQMYEQHIRGLIEGSMKRLSGEFGAPTHARPGAEKPYSIQRVGGVPVVRWEYTTDLPEEDPRANTASAVVYLVPSADALDIISLNTHLRNLEATRALGEQLISSLRVPLTIDAEAFGQDMRTAFGGTIGAALLAGGVAIAAGVWLWRRFRKAR